MVASDGVEPPRQPVQGWLQRTRAWNTANATVPGAPLLSEASTPATLSLLPVLNSISRPYR